MVDRKKHWLSSSSLGLFEECPHCFWLERNGKISRPRGIFPSLPGGMDLIIKKRFDRYRSEGLVPPEVEGYLGQGAKLYPNQPTLDKWRNWKSGLKWESDAFVLGGALDDVLELEKKLGPLDYKTKGSPPKDGDTEKYYSRQGDIYGLLLKANGFEILPEANFVYYHPVDTAAEKQGRVTFSFAITPVKTKIDTDRAISLIGRAVACLDGPLPLYHAGCDTCAYYLTQEEAYGKHDEPAAEGPGTEASVPV